MTRIKIKRAGAVVLVIAGFVALGVASHSASMPQNRTDAQTPSYATAMEPVQRG